MQRRLRPVLLISAAVLISTGLFFSNRAMSEEPAKPAPEAEPELVIVKYGSISVKSLEPGAKVYVDETYKGGADTVVESIVAGEHVISVRTDDKAVSGTFLVRKNETLRLEARFDEGKLLLLKESQKAEAEKKKPETGKPEKPKKAGAEPKRAEQKNPVEERRRTYLNVMKIDYEAADSVHIKVEHKANQSVISKYNVYRSGTGKYYHTKQGVLLCETGPCEMNWRASFIYTDETSKADALLLNWKETVFNGITPEGTSRQDLECCLNGQCWRMQYQNGKETAQEYEIGGKYRLNWEQRTILVRRADIMKEILDAGRELSDY